MKKKLVIAIDFDGVIATHTDKEGEIGKLIPGAKEIITFLKKDGHEIIIWTARKDMELDKIKKFLDNNSIPYDDINIGITWDDESSRKIFADIYIDDRAIRFNGDWFEIYTIIKTGKYIPWWDGKNKSILELYPTIV